MLGIDVHDCAAARNELYRDGPLQSGYVLTVEPGLYFQVNDRTVPPELRGIGVRIEDDILVTDGAAVNLSAALPRDPDEITAWMRDVQATPAAPMNLVLPPSRGLPHGLQIAEEELLERFSRSSGPGGQGVNTTDSKVALSWDIASSPSLDEAQREILLRQLGPRLHDGVLTIIASEQRSQLQNRQAARGRLTNLLRDAFVPAVQRRATRPSRAARQRRLDAKKQRAQVKAGRGRVRPD